MDIMSRDLKVEDAIQLLAAMLTVEEIDSFLSKDETRKTLLEAVSARKAELQAKAGEVKSITQKTADFKDGVQATKGASTSPPQAPPYQGGEKGEVKIKSYVTGEDVIRAMREKGRKI